MGYRSQKITKGKKKKREVTSSDFETTTGRPHLALKHFGFVGFAFGGGVIIFLGSRSSQ